jgi:hypothetical protein
MTTAVNLYLRILGLSHTYVDDLGYLDCLPLVGQAGWPAFPKLSCVCSVRVCVVRENNWLGHLGDLCCV